MYTRHTYKSGSVIGVGYLKNGTWGLGELDMDHPSQVQYKKDIKYALKRAAAELKKDIELCLQKTI